MKGWKVFFILALILLAAGFFCSVYSTQKYPGALNQERIYPYQTAGLTFIISGVALSILSYVMVLKQKT